jgi:hypothetical protein
MSGDSVVIVSNDTHVGPRLVEDLRPYCPASYLDEFDRPRQHEPGADPVRVVAARKADARSRLCGSSSSTSAPSPDRRVRRCSWTSPASGRLRAVASGADIPPFGLFVSSFMAGITGFLAAPASDSTRRWLGHAGNVPVQRLRLL